MTKQKVGLVIFWIAAIWAVLWGVIGSMLCGPAYKGTLDELNQTIWAPQSPMFLIWGLGGVTLGALLAGIGLLLYANARGRTIWLYGLGIFIGYLISMTVGVLGHIPVLFGIGGTLILLLFFGILWLWVKERMALKDASTISADLRLTGYVFMLMAAWFICGGLSQPFLKALEGEPTSSPIHIMILLVLGWFFLFLSHYKARK
jgi:hypothetical protein